MPRINALYFTAVNLGTNSNGGSLCCRNHIKRLNADSEIDLTVVAALEENWQQDSEKYVDSIGAKFIPLLMERSPWFHPRLMFRGLSRRYPLLLEKIAQRCGRVNSKFMLILKERQPDVVIVDHVPSSHFIPGLFSSSVPRCVITLNRETDFQLDFWTTKRRSVTALDRWIVNKRALAFERRIFTRSHGVVALTEHDLPTGLSPDTVRKVIPPFFDAESARWSYQGSRSLFFVGGIRHFPNRQAMQWICTRLAPEIEELDRTVRIRLIGASPDDVPEEWRRPSVEFLGLSDRSGVELLFRTADLFIAPIANSYGSKMKLLECLSFGTPFLATRTAMSGSPYLNGIPEFDLERPKEAAKIAVDFLDYSDKLVGLSQEISLKLNQHKVNQSGVWGQFLRRLPQSGNAGSSLWHRFQSAR